MCVENFLSSRVFSDFSREGSYITKFPRLISYQEPVGWLLHATEGGKSKNVCEDLYKFSERFFFSH